MPTIVRFLIIASIFVLIDWYVWQAVKITFGSSKTLKYSYWSITIFAILLLFLAFVVRPEFMRQRFMTFVFSGIFMIYISKILAVLFLFIDDIIRLFRWIGSFLVSSKTEIGSEILEKVKESGIPRSEFLAKTAIAVGGLNLGVLSFGIISGAHDYRIHRITLKLPNLPKAFEGMTLAQLSDIHSGSFYNKTAVKGGVEMLLKEKPDLVFFTGDLVNNEAKELDDYFDIFKKVTAPLGVYSILGNHDYGDYYPWKTTQAKEQNLETLIQAHKDMGWNILLDEHKKLTVNNESIGILGMQNWGSGNFAKYGSLEKTLLRTEDFDIKLLLSHDPSHWRAQVVGKTDIDAVFAGHTHGMQFGVEIGDFKWSPVKYRYPEWAGLYQEGKQQIYVNRGFGYLGYPGRVGILPEITIMTLVRG
jgi:uncharacterized protein